MSRHARRKDDNHGAVANAFRAAGCSWLNIEGSTAGAPDGVVGVAGRSLLIEIKPDTELSRHQPNEAQKAFAASWRGSPVHVVRSPAQAFELANLTRMGK